MDGLVFPTTAIALSERLGATLIGEPSRLVERLAPLASARSGCLSYCASQKFADEIETADDAVILTRAEWASAEKPNTFLVVPDPKAAFAEIAKTFAPAWGNPPGVSPTASIHPSVKLGLGVTVGPFAVVEAHAIIGAGSFIGAHTVVGTEVEIGAQSVLHPRVVIFPKVKVGDRVEIFSGTVVGADGFGIFGQTGEALTQMPQIGTVIIEDDVRIGANCTIDRATLGETRIESGVKIDNLVHVAHNCVVKRNSILCAQVGVAGSSTIEKNAILGGQVGIGHGVVVGENARMGGQTGVSTNVPANETYSGTPGLPVRETHQVFRYSQKLPELFRRVRALEKKAEGTQQNES